MSPSPNSCANCANRSQSAAPTRPPGIRIRPMRPSEARNIRTAPGQESVAPRAPGSRSVDRFSETDSRTGC